MQTATSMKHTFFAIAICALLLALPDVAFAGSGGNTEQGGMDLVTYLAGLLKGWFGMVLSIIALIAGLVSGLVQKNLWGLLFAWVIALACYRGPDFILSTFSAII